MVDELDAELEYETFFIVQLQQLATQQIENEFQSRREYNVRVVAE